MFFISRIAEDPVPKHPQIKVPTKGSKLEITLLNESEGDGVTLILIVTVILLD